jgi:signal transduction histidine kinase
LQIAYTATSLTIPERVRFRYKLEGQDQDWLEAGTRREAIYDNLGPGDYKFRVIAANNDGVWNESGAALEFSVLPAWYQTFWFYSACVAALALALWALHQLRLRQLERQFDKALETRVDERTRIARELHDTLLQSFQGILLRFQAVSNLLPVRPEEAKKDLDAAIDQASQAVAEGRGAVQGLRSSTAVSNDLAETIKTLGEELGASGNHQRPVFVVTVAGTPRDLRPIVRDEVYRIAGEALRNAFRHAQANRIEVELHYDPRQLRLRIRDDGKGIESHVVQNAGRAGHFGLHGMQERAKIIGANLELWSNVGSGTEVELTTPASHAYDVRGSQRPS